MKPGYAPGPLGLNMLIFISNSSNLIMKWFGGNNFQIHSIDLANYSTFSMDSSKLNSIALTFDENKLNMWINGEQFRSRTIQFIELNEIKVMVQTLGILSFYNRVLTKAEIIQHYIDNHVENWTNHIILL